MSDPWETFGRIWTYEFVVRGIIVTAITGAVCTVISCWIVLAGQSLMDSAPSHVVLSGTAIARTLGIPCSVGALAAALLAVGLISAMWQVSHPKSDASMDIIFTTLFAVGLVLVSKDPPNINLSHVLFGDLLGITQADVWQVLILGPLAGAVSLLRRRDLTVYVFSPVHLQAIGFLAWRMGALLLVCLATTIVMVIQAVGVVLIVVPLIMPGATAPLITQKFSKMLFIAPMLSVASTIVDVYISYWFDMASGATVVVASGFLPLTAWLVSPHEPRGLLRSRCAAV